MTRIVLDASVAATWYLPDEPSPVAAHALDRIVHAEVSVPDLFWHEMRNILLTNERRGRIRPTAVTGAIDHVRSLKLETIPTAGLVEDQDVLNMGRRLQLTAYDAAYLHLADRQGALLATLDQELIRAAQSASVQLLRPAGS